MKKAILVLAAITFLVFGLGIIRDVNKTNQELHIKRIELNNNEVKLKQLETDFHELNGTNAENEQQIQELESQRQQLEKEKADLEAQLQAKAKLKELQAKAYAAEAQPVPFTQRISGDKESWLRASGIPESEWKYVDSIVSRESGWDPCAYNPGKSNCNANPTSACGLAQSLPCGKQSVYGHWTDPVANLKWQYDYVKNRYGGYAQAVAFWNANKWY